MTYYEIIETIKDIASKHVLVHEVGDGDIYEYLNSSDHKYPCVFLTTQSVTDNDMHQTLNGTLFFVDRVTEDNANKVQVQSVGISVLRQIFRKLQDEYGELELKGNSFTVFEEKFADYCGGAFGQFQLSYLNEALCDDDVFVDDFDYLTFEALEDSALSMSKHSSLNPYIEYTYDCVQWIQWDFGNINLPKGTIIKMRGDNQGGLTQGWGIECSFVMTGKIAASGLLTSLMYMNKKPNGNITNEYGMAHLFRHCQALVTAPDITCDYICTSGLAGIYEDCVNLKYAKVTTTNFGYYALYYFMCDAGRDVEGEKVFVKKAGFDFPRGRDGVPEGWTLVDDN